MGPIRSCHTARLPAADDQCTAMCCRLANCARRCQLPSLLSEVRTGTPTAVGYSPDAASQTGAQRGRSRTSRAQRPLSRCSSREHPCTPPPYRSVHDPFNTASGVQDSGPWDPWLPGGAEQSTVRTARAQRTVHGAPPRTESF